MRFFQDFRAVAMDGHFDCCTAWVDIDIDGFEGLGCEEVLADFVVVAGAHAYLLPVCDG